MQNSAEFGPLPRWQQRVLVGLFLVVVCGFNLFVQPLGWASPSGHELLDSFGSIQTQVWIVLPMGLLLAFWTALAPAPLGRRVVVGLALLVLLVATAGGPGAGCQLIAGLLGVQFVVGLVAFQLLSSVFRWQLANRPEKLAEPGLSFGVGALLVAFFEVAAFVGVVSWLSHLGPAEPLSLPVLGAIVVHALYFALIAAPTIFIAGAILSGGRAQKLCAAMAIAGLAAVAFLADFGTGPLGPCLPGIPRFWANAATVIGIAAGGVAASSFLAACGYRLVRRPQSGSTEMNASQSTLPATGGPPFAVPLSILLLSLTAIALHAVSAVPNMLRNFEQLQFARVGLRPGSSYSGDVSEISVDDPAFNRAVAANDPKVLELLESVPELRELSLERSQNADVQIEFLSKYPRVNRLKLNDSSITDKGLNAVAKITGIEYLDLSDTSISDAGLAELASLPNLKELRLNHTKITDEGLSSIAKIAPLEKLDLSQTLIADTGIAKLHSLPNLNELKLRDTKITDAGAAELESFKNLHWIEFDKAAVTPEAVLRLRQAMPQVFISNY